MGKGKRKIKRLVFFLGDSVDDSSISEMGSIGGGTEDGGGKNYDLGFGHE